MEWMIKNKRFLSIRAIEIELNIPQGTLNKALNGTAELPKKHRKKIDVFVCELNK